MQGFGQRFCLKTMHIVFVDQQRQDSGRTLASSSHNIFSFTYNNADRGCDTVYNAVL